MSRIRNFLLLAVVAAVAVGFAACGDDDGGGGNEDPQAVLEGAKLKGIKSGDVDLSMTVAVEGREGGNLDLTLSGPFQSESRRELPQVDFDVTAKGSFQDDDLDFEGGLTLTRNSAFVNYKGTDYEVDAATYGVLRSALEQIQRQSQSEGDSPAACEKAVEGVGADDLLSNLTNEGTEEVGGAETTHVSGDLNVSGLLDVLARVSGNQACRRALGDQADQLPPPALLRQGESQLAEAVETAHVDLWVGEDGFIRRASGEVAVVPPEGTSAEAERIEIDFEMTIADVNEPQRIEGPGDAEPFNDLLRELGVDPSVLQALGGVGGLNGLGGLGGLGGGSGGGDAGGGNAGGGGGKSPLPLPVPDSSGGVPEPPTAKEQREYMSCLENAKTPADLQKCARALIE